MEYVITGTICLFIGVIIGVGVMGLVAGGIRDETESVPETVITPEVGEVFRKWDEQALEGVCQSGYKKTWVHRDIE